MTMQPDYDVIIIGAGPAGSTTASLLAEKGRRVLVVEKEALPRYHIGESMMPFCWFTLDRLGLAEKMDEIGFQQKYSVQFATVEGEVSKPFYFFEHNDHPSSTTWQVERQEFDQMLIDRAQQNGAVLRDRTRVIKVIDDAPGGLRQVVVRSADGERETLSATVIVDASGRDCLVSSKRRWRNRDPELNKIAMWTYYEDAKRDPGLDAGSTTIAYIPEKGWFWYIPMRNNRVSVGIVAERDYLYSGTQDTAEIFEREVKENVWIQDHLEPATQVGQYWVVSEYSYRSNFCASDGTVLVGDAFAFLDPVFSSGVFLALKSGELAADAIDEALTAGDVSAGRFQEYGDQLCLAIERMRKIVYAFYHNDFSFGKLIKQHPHLRPVLTDLLIGNVFVDQFDELFDAIEGICELPAELPYGKLVAETAAA